MSNNTSAKPTVEILKFRHFTKRAIRSLFDEQGFIELDTPYILGANTPDPYIDPVMVSLQSHKSGSLQLHTSPEIWLKHGLKLGFEKIYHMARVFRDDPPGRYHSIEFTMLEWYRGGENLSALIRDCEDIFRITSDIAAKHGFPDLFVKPFITVTLHELFKELVGLNLTAILHHIATGTPDHLQKILAQRNEHLPAQASFLDAFFHIMLKYIEPQLPFDQPVIISQWPTQLAALSAPCEEDPYFCDRFEIYFRGLEIANAYQECTDPELLRCRFLKENADRKAAGKPQFPIDESFLASVAHMPKTAGIALGLDRLFLAISGLNDISQIILGFREH
jgi:lysyl-tRNA synthetase class 2